MNPPRGPVRHAVRLGAWRRSASGSPSSNVTVGDLDANAEQLLAALRRRRGPGLRPRRHPRARPRRVPPRGPPVEGRLRGGCRRHAREARRGVTGVPGRRRHRACRRTPGSSRRARPADARDVAGAAARVPRRHLVNAAALVGAGRLHGAVAKRRLPNYSVFDEQRWFLPGAGAGRAVRRGRGGARRGRSARTSGSTRARPSSSPERAAGCSSCSTRRPTTADAARSASTSLRRRARRDGLRDRLRQPRRWPGRAGLRRREPGRARRSGARPRRRPAVRDGPARRRRGGPRGAAATPGVLPGRERAAGSPRPRGARARSPQPLGEIAEVYEALVTGTRDYLREERVPLRGDRAVRRHRLVARRHGRRRRARARRGARRGDAVAVQLAHSLDDARELAEPARHPLRRRPDRARARRARRACSTPCSAASPTGLTDENLQSRIRGVLLMGDLERHRRDRAHDGEQVRARDGLHDALRRLRRGLRGHQGRRQDPRLRAVPPPQRARASPRGRRRRSPSRSSTSRPSAELRPDQRDDDSLPPYDAARPGARGLRGGGPHRRRARRATGFDAALVERVAALVDAAEYKRRQMPPGRAHHGEVVRQGPPPADHEPLRAPRPS